MKNINEFTSKKEFEELLMSVLNPLKPYYSPKKAGLNLGNTSAHYENATVPFEAFSRPLWALAPFFSGGGMDLGFEEIYRNGIIAGTNPDSDEYWGDCHNYDQRFVEMAAIAFNLLLNPEKFWNPLSNKEKSNLVTWLSQINHFECHSCNWQFFCVLVNVALKVRGVAYDKERMELGLRRIDDYYIGGGWYKDGKVAQIDYYVPFAIQFYSVVYSVFMKDTDPDRCRIYEERARLFAKDFIYWFADSGEALPIGRSLSYRFAQVSFFSVCVAFKIDVLPVPVMKGLIVRHLNYWLNAPIFDKSGILTIGYTYPNLSMSENYNAPGSPYWSMKTFAFMALPKDDEFWSIKAEELPALDEIKTIACGNMITARKNGQVSVFTPGMVSPRQHTHTEEKYSKFVYSTKYGFSISRSQKNVGEAAPDSVLCFEVFGHIFVKELIKSFKINETNINIDWSPLNGINVQTKISISTGEHTRTHIIDSEYDCIAYDNGFSVSVDDYGTPERKASGNSAFVRNLDAFCQAECISGTGEGVIINASPNTNLIHSKTAIPTIKYTINKGHNKLVTRIIYE